MLYNPTHLPGVCPNSTGPVRGLAWNSSNWNEGKEGNSTSFLREEMLGVKLGKCRAHILGNVGKALFFLDGMALMCREEAEVVTQRPGGI